jgi:photosystem II stability/assembly factor-like uncharacterized protein
MRRSERPSSRRSRGPLLGLTALLLPLFVAGVAGSQPAAWRPVDGGLVGGPVLAIAGHPQRGEIAYAGTAGGLFVTTTGGATWRKAGEVGRGGVVDLIAVAPSRPATLYATARDGLFRSDDGGASWARADSGIQGWHVIALAVDPGAAEVVYAGVSEEGEPFSPARDWNVGVAKTTDGGRSWTIATLFRPVEGSLGTVVALAVDPSSGAIYAGELIGRVHASLDGGESWSARKPFDLLWGLVVGERSGTLYAATDDGVHRSADGGRSWSGTALRRTRIAVLAADAETPTTLYAAGSGGLRRSGDGGDTWERLPLDFRPRLMIARQELAVARAAPARVYAATVNGILASADRGDTWRTANEGLRAAAVSSLAFGARDGRTLYAVTESELAPVAKTSDGGIRWRRTSRGLDQRGVFYTVLVPDPHRPRTVYLGSSNGVYRSGDGGERWTRAARGMPSGSAINAIAVHPRRPRTLYAAGQRVFKSTDGGGTWRQLRFPGSPQTTWIQSLAIDPARPDRVYAGGGVSGGGGGGIFVSDDGGSSWRIAAGGARLGGAAAFAFPVRSRSVYAATSAGVYRSTDGGRTWRDASAGLPRAGGSAPGITALVAHPAARERLYVSTRDGAYTRGPSGTWRPIAGALPAAAVLTLALDPAGTRLYAGTYGGGVVSTPAPR